MPGLGRSTATKALAQLEAQGKVCCTSSGRDNARCLPDHWDLIVAVENDKPLTAPTATVPAKLTRSKPAAKSSERLAKGKLCAMVLERLRARPSQALSPTAIAKELEHSSGAIANALRRLAEAGEVSEVSQTSRCYARGGGPEGRAIA